MERKSSWRNAKITLLYVYFIIAASSNVHCVNLCPISYIVRVIVGMCTQFKVVLTIVVPLFCLFVCLLLKTVSRSQSRSPVQSGSDTEKINTKLSKDLGIVLDSYTTDHCMAPGYRYLFIS